MQADDFSEASIEAEEAQWVASVLSLYDYAAAHDQRYLNQQWRSISPLQAQELNSRTFCNRSTRARRLKETMK